MPALLLASLALAAPVPKAVPLDLKWQFNKGDVFYVKTDREIKTTLNPGPGASIQSGATRVWYKATVESATQKATELTLEFVSSKYSPRSNLDANDLQDIPGVKGKTASITLGPRGQITNWDCDQLKRVCPGEGGVTGDLYIRRALSELFLTVPGKPVMVGKGWDVELVVPYLNEESLKKQVRGRVVEVTGDVAKLATDTDHAVNSSKTGGGYDLKSQANKGTIWFDWKCGRLQRWEDSYTLSGSIGPIRVKGAAEWFTVETSVKSVITVSDQPPKDE